MKKIIAAIAVIIGMWAGIALAIHHKPAPAKAEAPYVVTKTVPLPQAKPVVPVAKHRPVHKAKPVVKAPVQPQCQDFDAICHLINR